MTDSLKEQKKALRRQIALLKKQHQAEAGQQSIRSSKRHIPYCSITLCPMKYVLIPLSVHGVRQKKSCFRWWQAKN